MRIVLLSLLFSYSLFGSPSEELWTEIHGDGAMTVAQKSDYKTRAEKIAKELIKDDFRPLARKTDTALNAIIKIAVLNLKKHGFYTDARKLEWDWNTKYSNFVEKAVSQRDIGDFEPLSKYLAAAYELLEYKLGYQICYLLRLTDIKSLLYCIPVCFKLLCKVGLDEFELHFVHDLKYRGLLPVITYWTSLIVCSIATFGAGVFFICSPIAMGIEFAMDRWVGPAVAPKLWNLVCTKNNHEGDFDARLAR